MKKGRHRRFEEARKLKQQGPGAFLGLEPTPSNGSDEAEAGDEDEFADIAERYGAFDDETAEEDEAEADER